MTHLGSNQSNLTTRLTPVAVTLAVSSLMTCNKNSNNEQLKSDLFKRHFNVIRMYFKQNLQTTLKVFFKDNENVSTFRFKNSHCTIFLKFYHKY